MITHHHSVFEEKKIGAAAELLNLGKWAWWRCLRPNRNELWELKVVLAYIIHILSVVARFPK